MNKLGGGVTCLDSVQNAFASADDDDDGDDDGDGDDSSLMG